MLANNLIKVALLDAGAVVLLDQRVQKDLLLQTARLHNNSIKSYKIQGKSNKANENSIKSINHK